MSTGHWPRTPEEAERVQREVAERVEIPTGPVLAPRTVTGLDVSYATASDQITAAGVLVDVASGDVIEVAMVEGVAAFPYVPGLLAFREVPILLRVLEQFRGAPDLLLCDGQGLAHPRRCGVACHLGFLPDIPRSGAPRRGSSASTTSPGHGAVSEPPLVDEGQVVGEVLRTQDGVKPVYVSPSHAIGVAQASDIVLSLCSRYRLPDPLRRADHISRQALHRAPRRGSP